MGTRSILAGLPPKLAKSHMTAAILQGHRESLFFCCHISRIVTLRHRGPHCVPAPTSRLIPGCRLPAMAVPAFPAALFLPSLWAPHSPPFPWPFLNIAAREPI